jgi:hypothetical protein
MRLKLKCILKNERFRMQTAFIRPRITASEHANDVQNFIRGENFLISWATISFPRRVCSKDSASQLSIRFGFTRPKGHYKLITF